MKATFEELETKRLILKQTINEDARTLYDGMFYNFEHYKYYYSLPYTNFEEFKAVVEKNNELYELGDYLKWSIYSKEEKKIVGLINVQMKDYINHSCKIGWIIGESYLNQGYATEAAKKIIEFVFKSGFHRIEVLIVEDNIPSIKVAEKLNMKLESIKEESYLLNNKYLNQKVYTLINKK